MANSRLTRWTPQRRDAFARDWNDGLDIDAMREKYGLRYVGSRVADLRRRGYVMAKRRGPKLRDSNGNTAGSWDNAAFEEPEELSHLLAALSERIIPSVGAGGKVISFFVSGEPRAMSVGTTVRAGTKSFQGRRGTPWATLVGVIGRTHAPSTPLEGPVSFAATFYVPRPVSAPKRVEWPLKRPDVDNLVHKLTDQFNGVFWRDDSQIVDLSVSKRFAGVRRPGVFITVEAL